MVSEVLVFFSAFFSLVGSGGDGPRCEVPLSPKAECVVKSWGRQTVEMFVLPRVEGSGHITLYESSGAKHVVPFDIADPTKGKKDCSAEVTCENGAVVSCEAPGISTHCSAWSTSVTCITYHEGGGSTVGSASCTD